MGVKELREELKKAREELYDTEFNVNAGREADYAQIKYLKKKVAQILTLINNKEEKKAKKRVNKKNKNINKINKKKDAKKKDKQKK